MKFKRVGEAPKQVAPVKKIVESLDTKAHLKAAERYRQLADLGAEDEINESTLDRHALTRAACECGIPSGELKETLLRKPLTEDAEDDAREQAMKNDPAVKQAARQLRVGEEDIVVLDFPDLSSVDEDDIEDISELEDVLDDCLEQAEFLTGRKDPKNRAQIENVMIIGQAGTGKSSIVRKWAKKAGVHLVEWILSTLEPEEIGGAVMPDEEDPRMIRHAMNSTTWKLLSQPRTVLFLDEFNRAKSSIRANVLQLVNDHMIPGPDGKLTYMPNILFTIAAVNPATSSYGGVIDTDKAERGRFKDIYMSTSKTQVLKHLDALYAELVENAIEQGNAKMAMRWQGTRALARALLQSRQFQFTSPDEEEAMEDDTRFRPTTPRNLETALQDSRGEKNRLIAEWGKSCDYRQKKTIEDILKDYVDVKDKANQVFGTATKSGVIGNKFQKTENPLEKLRSNLESRGIHI